MKKLHLIIIAVIIIIIVAGVCFKLGLNMGKKSMESEVAQYKKVVDYYFPVPAEALSISGEITEIQNNVLSIKTTIQDPYVLPNEWKKQIIKVTVNDETKITKFDMQTAEQIDVAISDLQVGSQVNAGAKENIKDKTEFVADYINLYITPALPALPPPPATE